jgi:hypothetical protein
MIIMHGHTNLKYYLVYQIKKNLVGVAFEGKRLLGRPRHRWEDIIKICIEEMGWGHRLD